MLLLCVLEDALGAEHFAVLHAVKLDFLLRVRLAVLDLRLRHLARLQSWVRRGCHRQPGQDLVVHRQVVRANLVRAFVVGTGNHAVLGEFADALIAEGVAAGQGDGLLLVVVVRLEADAAFEDGVHG